MKHYTSGFFPIALASISMLGALDCLAQTTDIPEGTVDFRINALKGLEEGGVSFTDIASWNQYRPLEGGDWLDCTLEVLPWNLSWAQSGTQLKLKFDDSIVNLETAFGTSDTPMNVTMGQLWNSTFNIKADFYINGEFGADGGTQIYVTNGAKVGVGSLKDNTSTVYSFKGEGTSLTMSSNTNFRGQISFEDGATFTGGNFDIGNSNVTFKNTTFNAHSNDNPVRGARSKGSLTLDNTLWNNFDTTQKKYLGNFLFLNLGADSDYVVTFKNGTKVDAAGKVVDGVATSWWNMDPETRKLSDITNQSNINIGWDESTSETPFSAIINIESGSKIASGNFEFANAGSTKSISGNIVVNQSGTNLTDGLTEVVIAGDINLRASETAGSSFSSQYNMLGFSDLKIKNNLNVGASNAKGGETSFNISGDYNSLSAGSITISKNESSAGNFGFFIGGNNNTVTLTSNINMKSGVNVNSSSVYSSLVFSADSSNNILSANALNSDFGPGGTHEIILGGKNNSLLLNGDLNLASDNFNSKSDAKAYFSMLGEGNVLKTNNFNITKSQDTTTSGTINVLLKGSSSENKNSIYVKSNGIALQASQVEGSTLHTLVSLQGNTVLRGVDDSTGLVLKVNEYGGKVFKTDTVFEVKGSGNDLLLTSLQVGNGVTGVMGKGIFKVEGSGSKIHIEGTNLNIRGGGEMHHFVDNTGISSIDVRNASVTTNGKLVVSFADMTRSTVDTEGNVGAWESFTLYTSDTTFYLNNWFSLTDIENPPNEELEYLVFNEEYVSIITREAADEFLFAIEVAYDEESNEQFNLIVMYKSTVPEPSTYALIFGAIALLLVYRKKNRK